LGKPSHGCIIGCHATLPKILRGALISLGGRSPVPLAPLRRSVPPETQYEYVVATVDVKEQKLKLFLDTIQVEEYEYQLRD
jgi:hypothetical protein